MIAVNKNKDIDSETLKRLVHKYGITDILLMLSDIWRFTYKPRSALIYRTLIEAREKIIGAERGYPTHTVQITDSNPPARDLDAQGGE